MSGSRVVLGSASPRRRELLQRLLDDFDVQPSEIDETLPPGPLPDAVAALALAKARAVAASTPAAIVLGADTIVTLDGAVFGKPADADDARAMLYRLRGRWHEVITGIAVVAADREMSTSVISRVEMAALADDTIDDYIRSGEPFDKAGAYAIQGLGGALITRLVGSYSNVVGLPLPETAAVLRSAGVTVRPAVSR